MRPMMSENCHLQLKKGKEKGEFKIPVKESIRLIEEQSADSPDRDSYLDLSGSLTDATSSDGSLVVAFRSNKRVIYALAVRLVAALLDQNLGAAKCTACGLWLDARDLQREAWKVIEPLAGGGGRTYLCPCGHTVLTITDWRS
ncbi:MAG: hypothetical protein GY722_23055 [bacterium]|nr:hypothetical protein [bacterium]